MLSPPVYPGALSNLLGLVVNIIVLWNTLYINAALEQLQAAGYLVQSEDVARLSPLVFELINLLGRYAFAVPDSVLRGELRPLRNPADSIEDVPERQTVWKLTFLTRFSVPLIPNTLDAPGRRRCEVEMVFGSGGVDEQTVGEGASGGVLGS